MLKSPYDLRKRVGDDPEDTKGKMPKETCGDETSHPRMHEDTRHFRF